MSRSSCCLEMCPVSTLGRTRLQPHWVLETASHTCIACRHCPIALLELLYTQHAVLDCVYVQTVLGLIFKFELYVYASYLFN